MKKKFSRHLRCKLPLLIGCVATCMLLYSSSVCAVMIDKFTDDLWVSQNGVEEQCDSVNEAMIRIPVLNSNPQRLRRKVKLLPFCAKLIIVPFSISETGEFYWKHHLILLPT